MKPVSMGTRWLPFWDIAAVGPKGIAEHTLTVVVPLLIVAFIATFVGREGLSRAAHVREKVAELGKVAPIDVTKGHSFRDLVSVDGELCRVARKIKEKDSKGKTSLRTAESRIIGGDLVDRQGNRFVLGKNDLSIENFAFRESLAPVEEIAAWEARSGISPKNGALYVGCARGISGLLSGQVVPPKKGEPTAYLPTYHLARGASLWAGISNSQPMVDAWAAGTAWRLSFLIVPWLVFLLFVFSYLEARPLLEALVDRAATPLPPMGRWMHLAWATPLAMLLIAAALYRLGEHRHDGASRSGYLWCALACAAAGATLLFCHHRYREVTHAFAPMAETPTRTIGELCAGTVELVARVSSPTEGAVGAVSGLRRAFSATAGFLIEQVTTGTGKNRSTSIRLTDSADNRQPSILDIEDSSGRAKLDLAHAILVLPALRRVYKQPPPAWDTIPGISPGAHTPYRYIVEEQYLREGDTVYVYGQIRELLADPSGQAAYRQASRIPFLGGTEERPLFVYAGSERGLVARVGIELYLLRGAFASVALSYGALACAIVWLVAQ